MKFLTIFACALVTASAHYLSPIYQGPQHHPVITKHGVPENTPEVQKARADHLALLSAAKSYANTYSHYSTNLPQEYKQQSYYGPQHIPVINKFGVPEDTEDVKQARQAHLAQVAAAKSYGYSQSSYGSYPKVYQGPQHVPVINKFGVPEETEEVKKAKSEHLAVVAAKSHSYSYSIPHLYQEKLAQTWNGPQHYPVIDKNGVPVDTVEVQKARAAHLSYVATAKSYAQKFNNYESSIPATSYQIQHVEQPYQGPQHIPVIYNGVPEETEEVKKAKQAHLAQVAAAKSYGYEQANYAVSAPVINKEVENYQNYFAVIGENGLPEETIEVQNAKAQHLADVAAAKEYLNSVGKAVAPLDTIEVQNAKAQHLAQVEATKEYFNLVGKAQVPKESFSIQGGKQQDLIEYSNVYSVPEETLEVQNARAKHLAQVAAAKANAYIPVLNNQGFPVETTEVQHAKAEHLLYKSEVEARDNNLRYLQKNSAGNSQAYDEPIAEEDDSYFLVIQPQEYESQVEKYENY